MKHDDVKFGDNICPNGIVHISPRHSVALFVLVQNLSEKDAEQMDGTDTNLIGSEGHQLEYLLSETLRQ